MYFKIEPDGMVTCSADKIDRQSFLNIVRSHLEEYRSREASYQPPQEPECDT